MHFFGDLTLVPRRRIMRDKETVATKEGTGDAHDDVVEHPRAFGSGRSSADDGMAPRLEGKGVAAEISCRCDHYVQGNSLATLNIKKRTSIGYQKGRM